MIGGGLLIGVMARWAWLQSKEIAVGWREVRIDALVLLANGLLAAQAAEVMHLSGIRLAVAAAMFGASSTMIFSAIHSAFVDRVGKSTQLFVGSGQIVPIPPVSPPIEVHAVGRNSIALSAELLAAFKAGELPDDPHIVDLLRQLGDVGDDETGL